MALKACIALLLLSSLGWAQGTFGLLDASVSDDNGQLVDVTLPGAQVVAHDSTTLSLTGFFQLPSTAQDASGQYVLPNLRVIWQLTGAEGEVLPSGPYRAWHGENLGGSVSVERFDAETGRVYARLGIPLGKEVGSYMTFPEFGLGASIAKVVVLTEQQLVDPFLGEVPADSLAMVEVGWETIEAPPRALLYDDLLQAGDFFRVIFVLPSVVEVETVLEIVSPGSNVLLGVPPVVTLQPGDGAFAVVGRAGISGASAINIKESGTPEGVYYAKTRPLLVVSAISPTVQGYSQAGRNSASYLYSLLDGVVGQFEGSPFSVPVFSEYTEGMDEGDIQAADDEALAMVLIPFVKIEYCVPPTPWPSGPGTPMWKKLCSWWAPSPPGLVSCPDKCSETDGPGVNEAFCAWSVGILPKECFFIPGHTVPVAVKKWTNVTPGGCEEEEGLSGTIPVGPEGEIWFTIDMSFIRKCCTFKQSDEWVIADMDMCTTNP
jgi:hypothetical protein